MKESIRSSFWTAQDVSIWTAFAYFIIVSIVLTTIFLYNRPCLLMSMDGTAWSIIFREQEMARLPYTQLGVDVLQGNFDAYNPAYREYFLPEIISTAFTGAGAGKVTTYSVYGALMMFSTFVMARAVGLSRSVALLAGFLLAVLALPTRIAGVSWVYPIYNLLPHLAQPVALTSIIVACFWAFDFRRSWIVTVGLGITAVSSVILSIVSFVTMTALMAPAIVLYAGSSLFSGGGWRQNIPRLVTAAVCLLIPASLGMVDYGRSLVGYTAYNFFGSEFIQARSDITFASIFYYEPFGRAIVVLGMAGAIYAALRGPRRLRMFALVHVAVTCLFQVTAFIIVKFADRYHGPSPVYFEFMLWPIMLMFSALLLSVVCWHVSVFLRSRLSIFSKRGWSTAPLNPIWRHFSLVSILVAIVMWNIGSAEARRPTPCPHFFPIKPTQITERLRRDIGVSIGAPFRGLVATFDGSQGRQSVNWMDLIAYDYSLWHTFGNDFRMVGLWWFNIPTLFHYSTLITPPYYLLLTDFLSRPTDKQLRSVLVLTEPNEKMLKLWGVRYVIADFDSNIGHTEIETAGSGPHRLRLIELRDPNLGGYSPTNVRRVESFREGLRVMHEPSFDGRRTLVSTDEIKEALVPARNASLVYEKAGLSVRAESDGLSVLVLPAQYSHCWTASGSGNPVLIRANLMQLGIVFKGRLDAKLAFRFGPLLAAQCRIDDIRDMERLRISDARASTPTDSTEGRH